MKIENWNQYLQNNALQTFQLLRFGTTLLIGILLAKVFGLDTETIAIYEVLLFLGNFLSFFWISAGVKSLLSQFGKAQNQQVSLLFNLAFLLFALGSLAGAILFFFQDSIINDFTQFKQLAHIELISIFLAFNAPSTLNEYIYLLQKKFRSIISYGIISFGTQLLAVSLPLIFGWGLRGVFAMLLLWSILKFCWLLILLGKFYYQEKKKTIVVNKKLRSPFNWSHQKRILLLILPLSLHMLIGGGMEYVDGFIVSSHFEDTRMFAIFRYGAREFPLVTILTTALTATLIPLAVENQALTIPKIKEAVDRLTNWLFPLTAFLMIISPYLFPIIYNENFAPSARIFNIYLLIISSRILLPQIIIYAQQHNYVLVWSAIIELVINLGLSLLLVQFYGLEGIAYATVIAYLVNKLILIAYTYITFQIPLTDYLNIPKFLCYNFFLVIAFFISLFI